MTPLRVTIVGAGLMGSWHARYLSRVGGTVVSVVDCDLRRAQQLSRRFPAAAFADLKESLDGVASDVVHVCTPAGSHFEHVSSALRAGRHVLVEKPVAESSSDVKSLVAIARDAGRKLCVVHQFPFQRGFRELLEHRSRRGKLTRVAFTAYTAGGAGRDAEGRRAVLLEIVPHPVSLLFALVGDDWPALQWNLARCSADDLRLVGHVGSVEVDVVVSLRGRPTRNELVVVGERGTAHVNLYHGFCVWERGDVSRMNKALQPLRFGARMVVKAATNLAIRAGRRQPAYPGLVELMRAFYDAIREGRPSPVSEAEMLAAAELMDRLRPAESEVGTARIASPDNEAGGPSLGRSTLAGKH